MILIDMSSLVYKTYHGNKTDIIGEDGVFSHNYFKHLLISALLWRSKILGASLKNRVVICTDSKPYWRTKYFNSVKDEYFKDYYLTEKTKKDINIEDYTYKGKREKDEYAKDVWGVTRNVIDFIKKHTDFIEIKVKESEADDIIAVLSKKFAEQEEIFIVAGDKDFKQLLSNDRIHIYNDNPFKKRGSSDFMVIDDPKMFIETHIMVGDVSDNIPNIKPRLGEKTAIKLYNNKELFEEILEVNPSVRFRYDVNRKMIDFNCIPKEIQDDIIKEYENTEAGGFNDLEIMDYLFENELNDLQIRRNEFQLSPTPIKTRLNTYFSKRRRNIAMTKEQLRADVCDSF